MKKNFTKKDWILLSISASLALFGVLYNEYVVKQDVSVQEIPMVINQTNVKIIDTSDIRFCDNDGNCTQKLSDKLHPKP